MKFINLLHGIQDSWTIKEKAKYLYNQLCIYVRYDDRFVYSKDLNLLKTIYYREVDIRNDEDLRVVCRTLNMLYFQLLQELQIQCQLIFKKSTVDRPIIVEDTALVFWDELGNKYYTNIIGDIENCKYGLDSSYFGILKNQYPEAQDVTPISAEERQKIDIKTGFIKSYYSNVLFNALRNEVKNSNSFLNFLQQAEGISKSDAAENIIYWKMKYLNRFIKFRDSSAGSDELKKFYKYLFSFSTLNSSELKKFNAYEFVKIDEKTSDISLLSVIEFNLNPSPLYYIFSKENQSYILISIPELLDKVKSYSERKGKKMIIQREHEEITFEEEI